jgi:hypothetical protein
MNIYQYASEQKAAAACDALNQNVDEGFAWIVCIDFDEEQNQPIYTIERTDMTNDYCP